MAGRKPRVTPDERGGTDPLKPRRRPGPKPGEGGISGNALPGSSGGHKWAEGNQAGRGNANNLKHGMYSGRALRSRAEAIVTAMLEDARCPSHLRSPAFAATLLAWGNAEAIASLAWDWMCDLLDEAGPQAIFGMSPGMMKAQSEVYKTHAQAASQLRSKLGIDPVGYAKIAKDLGIAANAAEDQLQRMATTGAEITSRRLGLVQGETA